MERVDDVAAAVVARLGTVSAMQLEKLVYYAQAWWMSAHDQPLFPDNVEAWADGPVVNHLYQQHRGRKLVSSWVTGDPQRLSAESIRLIDDIVARYGHLTGDELSEITHAETPWKATRGTLPPAARSRQAIPLTLMATYYRRQVLSSGDAVQYALANAALEGLRPDPDFDAELDAVAAGRKSIDEVIAALHDQYPAAG